MSRLLRMKKKEYPDEVTSKYEVGRALGKGAFGVVKQCRDKKSGEDYAIKIIDTEEMGAKALVALKKEIAIMRDLDHRHIVKMYEVIEVEEKTYIVMELIQGGELFDRLKDKETYSFSERDAATLIRFITLAIEYYHEKNIVHRDLKPENLLLISKEDDTSVKIADFGFATYVPRGGLEERCGSMLYIAPELLHKNKRYGLEADMWSLGVISYMLLCGRAPFYDSNVKQLQQMIKKDEISFEKEYWQDISDGAKEFVGALLNRNVEERLTATQALEHPWIQNLAQLPTTRLTGTTQRLAEYQEAKLRKALSTLRAVAAMTKALS